MRAWLAGLRGPGGSSEAIRNQSLARSISSSRSKSSALRPALDQDRSPSRLVDEGFGIPLANPADSPPVLQPEGLRYPGVLLGWLVHSPDHTTSDPRKQEMRRPTDTVIGPGRAGGDRRSCPGRGDVRAVSRGSSKNRAATDVVRRSEAHLPPNV